MISYISVTKSDAIQRMNQSTEFKEAKGLTELKQFLNVHFQNTLHEYDSKLILIQSEPAYEHYKNLLIQSLSENRWKERASMNVSSPKMEKDYTTRMENASLCLLSL